ncbi:3'(2'),5'-bisphosphate nucleotidase CysQ family protein [Allocoleopsis franciscana]|uniref:inositol-phosphate phosphatase n=1 Tax=Allocoleopsis franciscana PCC 7113 TaxID=1173027 RepID=K9WCT8_9CYAN|nr:3'(2'),5'-bisphosphate nucleotidase CysQ [Allocoleopsis franciscana]AFZ18048.1 3'-phosphoadenosine 5'-phosphosulfate (PAPS) 3'-phosphatase [Allocoleopsis franciscana PCC 7113]
MSELKDLGEGRYEGLEEIVAIARSVGWGAADILQSYYRGHTDDSSLELKIEEKKDGPVTAADVAANHYILQKLQEAFDPETFGYLSEETYKSLSEQTKESLVNTPWVWIIDPLDGTRDFINKTGEYAIHIALVHQGRPIVAVVVWPEAEKLYSATLGGGTFVETPEGAKTPIRVSSRDAIANLSLVASRTHRDERFNQLLAQLPFKTKHYVGSVGCKIATIIEQQADVYISLSGKSAPKDWDMAAPELILTEAGGQFTHFDGTPLMYNQGDINQWGGLMASNGFCHQELCTQASAILAKIDA